MSRVLLNEFFGVRHPIVQGGMTWVSRHELPAAVSEAGGLGVLGSGGMDPDDLARELARLREATEAPYGVNLPLVPVRPDGDEGVVPKLADVIVRDPVPIVFTGGGSPKRYTETFKQAGKRVVHVVPSVPLARKAVAAGVDAVVAESVEGGGHVMVDGLSTFSLLPQVVDALDVPVIAAGGIVDGRGVAAAMALGAAGVQIGTRFIATTECNAHPAYKRALVQAESDGAPLYSRGHHASRGLASPAVQHMIEMERGGASIEEVLAYRGRSRAYQGCIQGDLEEGILPAGAGVGMVQEIRSVAEVMEGLVNEYRRVLRELPGSIDADDSDDERGAA